MKLNKNIFLIISIFILILTGLLYFSFLKDVQLNKVFLGGIDSVYTLRLNDKEKKIVYYVKKEPQFLDGLYLTDKYFNEKTAIKIASNISPFFPPRVLNDYPGKVLVVLEYAVGGAGSTGYLIFNEDGKLITKDLFDLSFYNFAYDGKGTIVFKTLNGDSRFLIDVNGYTGQIIENSKRMFVQ